MTLDQAIAQQPAWVGLWIDWLVIAVFALPLTLLFWKESRMIAVVSFVSAMLGGIGVYWLHANMGFVKLLGLSHVIFWTPLAIFLYGKLKNANLSKWPQRIVTVVFITVVIALIFDYLDVIRWLLGERAPLAA